LIPAATAPALLLTFSPPIHTSLQSPSYLIGALGSELNSLQVRLSLVGELESCRSEQVANFSAISIGGTQV
jgi:hypothetical protein